MSLAKHPRAGEGVFVRLYWHFTLMVHYVHTIFYAHVEVELPLVCRFVTEQYNYKKIRVLVPII